MSLRKPYRSALSNARNLGSAKEGVSHWIWLRLTSIALIPLNLWFVISLMDLTVGKENINAAQWFANPYHATLSVLMFATLFFHTKLGLQVVIEDYVHHKAGRIIMLLLNYIVCSVAAVAVILSIGKMYFAG